MSPGPFINRNYATFTGPLSYDEAAYSYDISSQEGLWHTDLPIDTSYKFNDIGMLFFNNPAEYAYFHGYGNNINLITLEKGYYQDLPSLIANVLNTVFNGNIIANGSVIVNGAVVANGVVACNSVMTLSGISGDVATFMNTTREIANSKKSFDIPHPSKEDHRLRYVCVEGPSADVYVRGKLKDNTVIDLPEYWRHLVDPESINVVLTPIGSYQELFVEKIEWGTKVIVKNNAGGPINCSYVVYGERKDVSKNISEYKGLTENDYPGDNEEYIINAD